MKNQTLPDWYTIQEPIIDAAITRRRVSTPGRVVRRALGNFCEALANQLSAANIPDSWLARVNPSAKIIGMLIMIICTTLVHNLIPLAMMLITGIGITVSASISKKQIGKVWLGVPLFSLGIILPSILNVITPGHIVAVIWRPEPGSTIGPWHLPDIIGITSTGLTVACRFLLRALACVTFTALLTATTKQDALIDGLRRLGLPRVFGMILAMMQRYISVLLQTAEEIHLAKLSRTLNGGSTMREQQWAASGIGSLFRRTHSLTEEIHRAMVSRGYDGNIRIMSKSAFGLRDMLWPAICVIFSVLIIILDRLLIR
ncbi:MAG: cobalt ECF transporter T component CbiQ [Armatimonadota bacterium]